MAGVPVKPSWHFTEHEGAVTGFSTVPMLEHGVPLSPPVAPVGIGNDEHDFSTHDRVAGGFRFPVMSQVTVAVPAT